MTFGPPLVQWVNGLKQVAHHYIFVWMPYRSTHRVNDRSGAQSIWPTVSLYLQRTHGISMVPICGYGPGASRCNICEEMPHAINPRFVIRCVSIRTPFDIVKWRSSSELVHIVHIVHIVGYVTSPTPRFEDEVWTTISSWWRPLRYGRTRRVVMLYGAHHAHQHRNWC